MTTPLDLSRLEALLESAQLLHSSLNLKDLLRHLLRSVMGHLLVGRGMIAVAGDSGMRLALVRGMPKLTAGNLFDEAAARAAGVERIFPIGKADQPIGILGISHPTSRKIDSEEEEFLKALLGIAASGIANAFAHKEVHRLNQDLNQKIQDLRALLDLVRGLTSTLEPEGVAQLLLLTLAGHWAVRKYAIAASKQDHPIVLRQKGIELPEFEAFKQLLADLPEAILVQELPEGEIKEALRAQQAELLLPIHSSSKDSNSISGLVLLGPRPGNLSYTESDLEFGAGLVAQAAVAFQNAWYFRETIERKEMEARLQAQKQTDLVFFALADILTGTVLDGKYRLDSKIGTGGFGAVYKATHLELGRPVAVKIFRPMPGNDTPEAFERFRLEGIAACRISHPNAVSILDSGITKMNIAYLVMELLEGYTLTDELQKKGLLPISRCAEILIPICNVLSEAHALGIVHRDIKPDNIFLHQAAEGEVVKVFDFGIAKVFGEIPNVNLQQLTIGGELLGTPAYIPPERLQGKPYDGRADIYSLGVMLYEMLCGKLPFEIDEKGIVGLMVKHINEKPPSLFEINPSVPREVDSIVMRTLMKDPALRPTAKELAEEFLKAITLLPEGKTTKTQRTQRRI